MAIQNLSSWDITTYGSHILIQSKCYLYDTVRAVSSEIQGFKQQLPNTHFFGKKWFMYR